MANDLPDFAHRLNVLAAGLGGDAMKGVMTKLGVEAKRDAVVAASRDLGGDARFSGWPKAGELGVRFDHVANGVIEFTPTPRTRGPWVVAEFGRKAGMSRGRKGGKRRRGADGVVRASTAKASRRVGATRGKNTWSDAVELIERETPERAMSALEDAVRGILLG